MTLSRTEERPPHWVIWPTLHRVPYAILVSLSLTMAMAGGAADSWPVFTIGLMWFCAFNRAMDREWERRCRAFNVEPYT